MVDIEGSKCKIVFECIEYHFVILDSRVQQTYTFNLLNWKTQ